MTLHGRKKENKKSDKQKDKGITANLSKENIKKAVLSEAERSGTQKDIQKKLSKKGISVSSPTISKYLKEQWGADYKRKKQEMSERKKRERKWKKEFQARRVGIDSTFHKDYITNTDGLMYDPETNTLRAPPPVEEIAKMNKEDRKNFINFSKDGWFGYKPNEQNPDELGSVDLSVKYIVKKQLERRLKNLRNIEIHELRKKEVEKELKKIRKNLSEEDKTLMEKKIRRTVRKEFKKSDEAKRIRKKYDLKTKEILEFVDNMKTDSRSRVVFGKDVIGGNLDPAYASSSKETRGRTRMLAEEDNPFSRATHNIPFIEWAHPKRIQVHSAQLSKQKATMIKPEKPIVKAKHNDIWGKNLTTRMPKNWEEDLATRDGAIIISKKAAKEMAYFRPVESGNLMIDDTKKIPPTLRVPKEITSYEDYKKFNVETALDVERGDPIIFSGVDDNAVKAADVFTRHSGKLVLVGEPTKHKRVITIQPELDPLNRDTLEIYYYRQKYQIVRSDELRVGDKVVGRTGVKSVISDIRDNLGKDKKGKPIEVIVNYEDVWRQSADSEKDEVYFKQGKKKSHMVLEHMQGNGKMFYHLIDKFAQDQGGEGLRISTTMLSGLWEIAYSDIINKPGYTQRDLDNGMRSFIETYFGEPSTLIANMKALHYKFVRDGSNIRLEIDKNEPTPDNFGEVIPFYHVANGHEYKYAYIPNEIGARVYSDGKVIRERYKIYSDNPVESSQHWYQLATTIRNSMYIFPTIENAIDLVAVPYVNKKDPTDVNTVIMDSSDIIRLGGNPYDTDLKVSWRKEPITDYQSIQTANVQADFTGKYDGVIAINPILAKKAVLDYDGDQVSVFTPEVRKAKIELKKDEIDDLEKLKKKNFDQEQFEKLYSKAAETKYAKDLDELAVQTAQYNQNIAKTENTLIKQYGGLRRSALLLYGSKRPEKITIGAGDNKREFDITPGLVNQVTDVEKILKLKEPYWKLKELYNKPWKDLTEEERDLAQDYYIRKELKRRIRKITDTSSGKKLREILSSEKSYMGDDGSVIYRGFDPRGLVIDTKSDNLLDNILLHMIKTSGVQVFEKEGQEQ